MNVQKITKDSYPLLLRQLKKLPESMDMIGKLPSDENKFLCIIGSRQNSSYGREVCSRLIQGLRGYPIVVVSGLAVGIDSIAHEEALKAGLKTVSFPGSGLARSSLYPSSRRKLASRIIEEGGALLSPFRSEQIGAYWTFPTRNALMAGVSHAVLIIEGREKSGTMITAKAAGEFHRDLLVVPGSIFSEFSGGPNKLLREGAIAITSSEDILEVLGFTPHTSHAQQTLLDLDSLSLSKEQRRIIECLRGELLSSTDIIEQTSLSASVFNIAISEMELRGLIVESSGRYRLT